MSDQSPPPKPKPGSLRDRIAAFENKGGIAPPAVPGPPLPRPKPGGLQWKPRPPSPPTSPDHTQYAERKPPSTAGMSASDAVESIGRGGSLKERMAALQGAFGGPPPPIAPKPNVERPKWKPPPAIPAPVTSDDESREGIARVDAGGRGASRSPPPRAVESPTPDSQGVSSREADVPAHEGGAGDLDPEEEERQRRAAIAARMARLGGARLGMGPPIFAPKPVIRKSELVPEAKLEVAVDEQPVPKEPSEVVVTSPPHGLPAAVSPEVIAESERRDESESPPPVPTRAPTSMPIPAGPRRAVPPRKKAAKPAPAAALPEPPAEQTEGVAIQSPPIPDEPPATADQAVPDTSLSTPDAHNASGEVEGNVEAVFEEHPGVAEAPAPPPVPAESFHEPLEEPEKQEAEEEPVDGAGSHVEDQSRHTTADDQEVPFEQPSEATEVDEEDEEVRHQRVTDRLAQMDAFNPLVGPPPVPQRLPIDESAVVLSEEPLDVDDEVDVDNEEYGETIPSPPVVPPRHDYVQSIKHDVIESHVEATVQENINVNEVDQAPAHRDGEHAVASYTEEQGGGPDGHTLPSQELSEEPVEYESHVVAQQEQGTASVQEAEAFESSGTALLYAEAREPSQRDRDGEERVARSTTVEIERERDTTKEVALAQAPVDEMPPPRITRPIPPPPVNLRSKPISPSPSSPPLSPPPRTALQGLRSAEEEECPASPDIPPRPIPPPGRSGSLVEDVPSPPPRRSIPPPLRRTSVRVTDSVLEAPAPPPPVPTSPRPVSRRPATPPIITTLAVSEQVAPEAHGNVERATAETLGDETPHPDMQEDDVSARRRAIAERMARLGGIRFGAPPPMNPLSRPPLPPAPPPTSIPPDDVEEEENEDQGTHEQDEEADEAARKRRIAAKLAGMGGMRLGMLPSVAGLPPPSARWHVSRQEDSESEDTVPPVPVPAPPQRPPSMRKPPPPVEQEPERAGRESRGTSDDGVRVEAEESELEEVRYSDAEPPVLSEEEQSPRRSTRPPRSAEALPTPPPRMTSRSPPPGRPIPIIPTALLGRRPSGATVSSSRQTSLDESSAGDTPTMIGRASDGSVRSHSEYVMVEAEGDETDAPVSLPRYRSTRGSVRSIPLPPPPPPSAIDPPETLSSSAQWELPSIPQGIEFGEGSELASSRWSEDSTAVHVPPPVVSSYPSSKGPLGKAGLPSSTTTVSVSVAESGTGSGSGLASGRRSVDQQQPQLTTEELKTISEKVGVQVVEAATTLFEKSKRALVGDGSYAGFVRAALAQVSVTAAHRPTGAEDEWGYVVYAQTGNVVQRRISDILPGDVIAFWDAKLKGHKGLHAYTQIAGTGAGAGAGEGGGPMVGIVNGFDGKKSKVRVWQANQHVGQQTVENVSYRLEDLKSGQVKVYRVLEA